MYEEQTPYADTFSNGMSGFANPLNIHVPQRDRRECTGRVTRVNSGLLDMLHDAAEIQVNTVVEGIDIDFDGIVEESIDKYRMFWRSLGSAIDVIAQHGFVVDDFHPAAAKNV